MKRASWSMCSALIVALGGCDEGGGGADAAALDGASREDASVDAGAPPADAASDAGGDASADANVACATHHDCAQGEYCHRGECRFEADQPVYHCGRSGCPPGRWCVEADGRRSVCEEDDAYRCENACECGPGFCCAGNRCVRDEADPLLGDPSSTASSCPVGPEVAFDARVPTYCATDPTCFAGERAWEQSERRGTFLAFDPSTGAATTVCGGRSCFGTACGCDPGESCVETVDSYVPPGVACGRLSGGSCVSHALAEAVFRWAPADLLDCCEAGCRDGERCEAGWMTNGNRYGFERVVATCAPAGSCTCGDGECCPDELATCLADCVPGAPTCGDGRCDPFEHDRACPADCPAGCGDGRCRFGESETSCAIDCAGSCGDGWCSAAESTAGSCAADCDGRCTGAVAYNRAHRVCGDGVCAQSSACDLEEPESCVTCAADCGACEWEVVHRAPPAVSLSELGYTLTDLWVSGPGAELVSAWGGDASLFERRGPDFVPVDLGGLAPDVHALWSDGTVTVAVGRRSSGAAALIREAGSWAEMSVPSATTFEELGSVWGSGRSNVWAASATHLYRFDGAAWSEVTGVGLARLGEVWTSAPDDTYVVGTHCTSGCAAGAPWGSVTRWSGASFTEVATADGDLNAVWGSGPSDVFAVGDGGTILHFDGSSWSPMTSGTAADLLDVWGSAPDDVYVAGDSVLLHYDGTTWSTVDVGAPIPGGSFTEARVHGGAAGHLLLLVKGDTDVMLRRFDGAAWSDALVGAERAELVDAAALGSGTIYVIGGAFRRDSGDWTGRLARLDGQRLRWIEPGAADHDLRAVGVAPSGRVYAAGAVLDEDGWVLEGRVWSYDDTVWSAEHTMIDAGTDVAVVAEDEVYVAVAGPPGTDSAEHTQHFNGVRWRSMAGAGFAAGLTHASTLTVNTSGDLIVAGTDGSLSAIPFVAYVSGGTATVLGEAVAARRYTSIWAASPAEALGYGGCERCRPRFPTTYFERHAGGESTLVESARGASFTVDGLAADDAVRVGPAGFLEVYDGSTWRRPAADLRQPGSYTCPALHRVLPVDGTYYVFGELEIVLRRLEPAP